MQNLLFLLALLLVTVAPTHAQDHYQLRQPNAEEYLQAIPHILAKGQFETYPETEQPIKYPFVSAVDQELRWRYPDLSNVDADLLHATLTTLLTDQNQPIWDIREVFVRPLIAAWLNQHQIDLNTVNSLDIYEFKLTITPRDYDGDGLNEWVLQVSSDIYSQHMVIKQQNGAYELIDSPLPWFGSGFPYWFTYSGFMEEQYFGDMTNDGLPEWVLALGGVGGNHQNLGWLYILQWQEGKLIDLTPNLSDFADFDYVMEYHAIAGGGSPLFPYGVSVTLEDVDSNGTIEVLIHQDFDDSWGCKFAETRTFAWNGSQFEHTDEAHNFEDSALCALRVARDLTWTGDYAAAIPFYERSLELFTSQPPTGDTPAYTVSWQSYEAYTAVHLALAYAMTGQEDAAYDLLVNLNPSDFEMPISDLVEVSQTSFLDDKHLFNLCAAMYETFVNYHRQAGWGADPYWGNTSDLRYTYAGPGSGSAPSLNPAKAGCDVDALLEKMLDGVVFTTDSPPTEQLDALGITVDQMRTFDIDGDGSDEWLVWFSSPQLHPILFVANGQSYHVSRPAVDYPDQYTDFHAFNLPDDSGSVLIQTYFDAETPIEERWRWGGGGMGGSSRECIDRQGEPIDLYDYFFGFVDLWLLEDYELNLMQDEVICESVAFNDIFPAGSNEMHVWRYSDESNAEGRNLVVPAVFIWDKTQRRYIAPAMSSDKTVSANESDQLIDFHFISTAFQSGDYETAVAIAKNRLETDLTEHDRYQTQYYRAMALEVLDRPDEALAEYVAIYESAPDSAWGMLAALHIVER